MPELFTNSIWERHVVSALTRAVNLIRMMCLRQYTVQSLHCNCHIVAERVKKLSLAISQQLNGHALSTIRREGENIV